MPYLHTDYGATQKQYQNNCNNGMQRWREVTQVKLNRVFPKDGSIITSHRETDGCYSVYVEFLVNEKGDLKFRLINNKGDNVTQDEFMMGPATAYSISENNHEVMTSFDMENDQGLSSDNGISWKDTIR